MPNFKQGGRGFQMKGWSAFTKKDDYTPQSQRNDKEYTPQSQKEETKPSINVNFKTKEKQIPKWKQSLKKIGNTILKTQPMYHAVKLGDKLSGGKLSDAAKKYGDVWKSRVKKIKKATGLKKKERKIY